MKFGNSSFKGQKLKLQHDQKFWKWSECRQYIVFWCCIIPHDLSTTLHVFCVTFPSQYIRDAGQNLKHRALMQHPTFQDTMSVRRCISGFISPTFRTKPVPLPDPRGHHQGASALLGRQPPPSISLSSTIQEMLTYLPLTCTPSC